MMLEGDIRAGCSALALDVEVAQGFPAALDLLAESASLCRGFLRAAWFASGGEADGRTLVGRRGDGTPVAALPLVAVGPALIGARTVPGSYWPFRAMPIAADATCDELAALFLHPAARAALAPMWRIGPVYADDPATTQLKRAAARAGWTVLTRDIGRTFLFDLGAMRADNAWPRKSTRRRLANYERQLAQEGAIAVRHVTGADWYSDVFEVLAGVEAASWIGTATDGSGAKFLTWQQRERWRRAVQDPVLARALSATILYVGSRPAAFSFDLRAGTTQYGIASSYDEAFAACRPGKIVTYRQLLHALESGVETVDLGAGDSGYKREMGAVPGSRILDLLIVRSRPAAQLLRLRWGSESAIGRDAFLAALAERNAGRKSALEPLLAAGALAAAMLALTD